METLKYKIIKTEEQYNEYCSMLAAFPGTKNNPVLPDEIELLTF
jgi:HTH-type transcriptional regulator / antitoxin HigA